MLVTQSHMTETILINWSTVKPTLLEGHSTQKMSRKLQEASQVQQTVSTDHWSQ